MAGIRPKQMARMGEFYLQEAIMDVLLDASYEDDCIGPAEISRRAGVFRERGSEDIMNDAIATGILVKLLDENKVRRCKQDNGKGGWELTPEEFKRRRDDIGS